MFNAISYFVRHVRVIKLKKSRDTCFQCWDVTSIVADTHAYDFRVVHFARNNISYPI